MTVNNKVSNIIDQENNQNEKNSLSQEEKIDYIFRYVKKQERSAVIRRNIKLVFYLGVIVYFYIMIAVVLPRMIGGIIPGVDVSSFTERFFGNEESSSQNTDAASEVLDESQGTNY